MTKDRQIAQPSLVGDVELSNQSSALVQDFGFHWVSKFLDLPQKVLLI